MRVYVKLQSRGAIQDGVSSKLFWYVTRDQSHGKNRWKLAEIKVFSTRTKLDKNNGGKMDF